ncbi:MAG: dihydroorotate dehydrogenase electron transfer subunit [Acetobacteraceae bacterium]|nr:dihydroorotate dehydrogenase electron transfer subunit [Acetobacteraceae bacterium]
MQWGEQAPGRPLWRQVLGRVLEQRQVGPNSYLLGLQQPWLAEAGRPGQFVHVRCGQGRDPLLRRPLSLFGVDPGEGRVELLYQVVGRGTALLSGLRPGMDVDLMGPLGRGFPRPPDGEGLCLVAGGLGVAPLVPAAQAWGAGRRVLALVGADTAAELLPEVQRRLVEAGAEVQLATMDGSRGTPGPVTDLLEGAIAREADAGRTGGWVVFACGPSAMLRRTAALAQSAGWPCYLCLEARMGCGVGACAGCAWPAAPDRPGGRFVRVCRDGPVFLAQEVGWWE